MPFFWAAIRRNLVSLLRFSILSRVQFSRVKLPLFVTWNVYAVVFLPIFVFWLFLLCWSLCILFRGRNQFSSALKLLWIVNLLSSSRIDASTRYWMLASLLSPFLDTYSMLTLFLGCKALCIVMGFLVLGSISWSSSRVYFRYGPKYLTRGIAQIFIS